MLMHVLQVQSYPSLCLLQMALRLPQCVTRSSDGQLSKIQDKEEAAWSGPSMGKLCLCSANISWLQGLQRLFGSARWLKYLTRCSLKF